MNRSIVLAIALLSGCVYRAGPETVTAVPPPAEPGAPFLIVRVSCTGDYAASPTRVAEARVSAVEAKHPLIIVTRDGARDYAIEGAVARETRVRSTGWWTIPRAHRTLLLRAYADDIAPDISNGLGHRCRTDVTFEQRYFPEE